MLLYCSLPVDRDTAPPSFRIPTPCDASTLGLLPGSATYNFTSCIFYTAVSIRQPPL